MAAADPTNRSLRTFQPVRLGEDWQFPALVVASGDRFTDEPWQKGRRGRI
jgi:hypothetical protein